MRLPTERAQSEHFENISSFATTRFNRHRRGMRHAGAAAQLRRFHSSEASLAFSFATN
jgi:hypothetical protein